MNVTYLPSNRQRKALLVQGQPISLALPMPPQPIRDAADWARSVLPTDLRDYVRGAEEAEVMVEPYLTAGPPDSLTRVMGSIIDAPRPGRFCATTLAVVVDLSPDKPRHGALPTQWPQNVMLDGKPLLGPTDAP